MINTTVVITFAPVARLEAVRLLLAFAYMSGFKLFQMDVKSAFLKGICSVRLTWDVSVRDLNRQLGTPSHWLPVDSCKEGQKGCPSGRLHSDGQVSQQETPKKRLCTSVSEHRVWHSEGGKKETVSSVYFSF